MTNRIIRSIWIHSFALALICTITVLLRDNAIAVYLGIIGMLVTIFGLCSKASELLWEKELQKRKNR